MCVVFNTFFYYFLLCVCMCVYVSGACSIFFCCFPLCVYVNMCCVQHLLFLSVVCICVCMWAWVVLAAPSIPVCLVISSQPLTKCQLVWLSYEVPESFCLHHPHPPSAGVTGICSQDLLSFLCRCLRFKLGPQACTESMWSPQLHIEISSSPHRVFRLCFLTSPQRVNIHGKFEKGLIFYSFPSLWLLLSNSYNLPFSPKIYPTSPCLPPFILVSFDSNLRLCIPLVMEEFFSKYRSWETVQWPKSKQ